MEPAEYCQLLSRLSGRAFQDEVSAFLSKYRALSSRSRALRQKPVEARQRRHRTKGPDFPRSDVPVGLAARACVEQPGGGRRRPAAARNATPHPLLTDDEFTALLEQCQPWVSRFVRWAVNTGMDRGKILSLTWADVDRRARIVVAPRSKTRAKRNLPINDKLTGLLDECDAVRGRASGSRVFLDDEGHPPEVDRLASSVRRDYARAGIEGAAPFKVLRHTFASRLLMSGVPIALVAKLLGHSVQ